MVLTNPISHLAGQVKHPGPSISLCAQSLHWIKAYFCVPLAKIKTFCTNVWVLLYKNFSSYGTSSSCCLRKYINILFYFFCTNIFSISPPLSITFNCTLSYLILHWQLPPPSPVEHFVFTLSPQRQITGWGGYPSWGVRAGGWRRWVQMVRVAPLRVRGGRAAFVVLLRWQVLAAWSGWRGDGLWIIIQVTGIAFGCRCCDPSAGGIVTVTDICAAGRCGRCKMPVAVRPVAGVERFMGKALAYRKTDCSFWATHPWTSERRISQGGDGKQVSLSAADTQYRTLLFLNPQTH